MSELVQQYEIPNPYEAAQAPTDLVSSFELLLDHYRRGILQIPPHQRKDDAWDRKKKRTYVNRLRESTEGSHPTGAFSTYQIVSANSPPSASFLNDGYQRLTTLNELNQSPESFAMDEPGVSRLLRQPVSVQHRHYESHERAMRDFQLINAGTTLTAYELCQGYLRYMPSYKEVWEPCFSQVTQVLLDTSARLRAKERSNNRPTEHKKMRDDLALLYRFLSEDKAASYYSDIGKSAVDQDLVDGSQVIEMRLRDLLIGIGAAEGPKRIGLFRDHIERETALIESLRNDVLGEGVGLRSVLWRWMLHFSIWRRNNRVPVDKQQELVRRVLAGTKGTSEWITEDSKLTFGHAHLGLLAKVTELAEMPELKTVRQRKNGGLRPGFDDSHEKPLSLYGEGPSFAEPASLNRARGAKAVER